MQGLDQIPSRSVGYILRIIGQNPTEDDIVEMVMKVIKQNQPLFIMEIWVLLAFLCRDKMEQNVEMKYPEKLLNFGR